MTEAEFSSVPFRFAEGMPDPVRDAVLQWWRSTGSRSGRSWEWLRPNTALPDDPINGDEDDVFPPNFDDWHEILGRVCGSTDLAEAADRFAEAHGALPGLWCRLIVKTMGLPRRYRFEDPRTNEQKAAVLRPLLYHIRQIARIVGSDMAPARPEIEPSRSARKLPVKARYFDTDQGPNEYRVEREWRKLRSKHRLFNVSLLEDTWSDPTELRLMQLHTGQGLCRKPKPLRSSAQISIPDFGRIAKALDAPLQAALQELSGQDPIQLSKGNSWHRYAVLHLQEVFATVFEPQRLMELRPGPNGVMAALINAAVPANVAAPVSPERISEIRARLAIRKKD